MSNAQPAKKALCWQTNIHHIHTEKKLMQNTLHVFGILHFVHTYACGNCCCECVSNYECSQHRSMYIFIWHVAITTYWLTDWCHFMLAEDRVKNIKWNETRVAGTIKREKVLLVGERLEYIHAERTEPTVELKQITRQLLVLITADLLFLFFFLHFPPSSTSHFLFFFSSSFFRPRYPTCRTKEDLNARERGRTYISMFACCTAQPFCCLYIYIYI